jgi:hypothetical protein
MQRIHTHTSVHARPDNDAVLLWYEPLGTLANLNPYFSSGTPCMAFLV